MNHDAYLLLNKKKQIGGGYMLISQQFIMVQQMKLSHIIYRVNRKY